MPLSDVRLVGDPGLASRAHDVEEFGAATQSLANRLKQWLRTSDRGIGLAAPQIGCSVRVFAYDLTDHLPALGLGVVINPEIEGLGSPVVYEEGCLSIPDLWLQIERPESIGVTFRDESGDFREVELGGIAARLFQHEADHLDGKLIIDHFPRKERTRILMDYQSGAGHKRRSVRRWLG